MLSGGDIKGVQGDIGHAQTSMVAERYAHILDDSRCINAERFQQQFYSGMVSQEPMKQPSSTRSKNLTLVGNMRFFSNSLYFCRNMVELHISTGLLLRMNARCIVAERFDCYNEYTSKVDCR